MLCYIIMFLHYIISYYIISYFRRGPRAESRPSVFLFLLERALMCQTHMPCTWRVPSETFIYPFTFPIKYNPSLKHRALCVALAEKTYGALIFPRPCVFRRWAGLGRSCHRFSILKCAGPCHADADLHVHTQDVFAHVRCVDGLINH